MATTNQKGGVGAKLTNLQAGVQKNFTTKTTLPASGTTYTQATLLAAIAAVLAPYTALAGFLAQAKTARQALKNGPAAAAEALLKVVVPALRAMYGANNVILLDFGVAPAKERAPLSTTKQMARQTKATATRKLRNTMGSKQKAAIKATGEVNVSASLATPPSAGNAANQVSATPAATAAPLAPAPAAVVAPAAVAPAAVAPAVVAPAAVAPAATPA